MTAIQNHAHCQWPPHKTNYISLHSYIQMNEKQVQHAKRSVAKVMGVHRAFNYKEPYILNEDVQFGGTAFFVHRSVFGTSFPIKDKNVRFALTNFHVVDELTNTHCNLCFPNKGRSKIVAEVVYVVPSLDVAILKIDPAGDHPLWFDSDSVKDYIKSIPNLKINECSVKGNSQKVVAIGFPNLSSDYQLCEGCISGRGLGMLQLSISLNGGNSGGPLMMNGQVIGINTASIKDSEALGLAVPIHQILRFFQYWTQYNSTILNVPSWGFLGNTTTEEYLQYHEIETPIHGCSIEKIIKDGPLGCSRVHQNDIIMNIYTTNRRYKVDNFGLISVDWTDKKVPLDNQEFILTLDPENIRIDIFRWRSKTIVKQVPIKLFPIHFNVRETFEQWEDVPYYVIGGMVFMNLSMNHLKVEDEEDEAYCPPEQAIPLVNFSQSNMHLKTAVVVTHIPQQSHISTLGVISPFDRIVKCNNKTIKDVTHLQQIIHKHTMRCNQSKTSKQDEYIVLETNKSKIYLSIERLRVKEIQDIVEGIYPPESCHLHTIQTHSQVHKRKYTELLGALE